MTGKVTRDLLKAGQFPLCLNQTFAAVGSNTETRKIKSPHKKYLARQELQTVVSFSLGLMGIYAFVGLAYAVFGEVTINITGPMVVISTMLGLFLPIIDVIAFLDTDTAKHSDDLATFEKSLKKVMTELRSSGIVPSRNIELMIDSEVIELSRAIITLCAHNVLVWEQKNGFGSPTGENLRVCLKQKFDLFKLYGLLGPHETYKPFYEEAQRKIEASLILTTEQEEVVS